MKLLDLLLDVDGILGNFIDPALDDIAAVTGVRHHHDEVNQWDIMASLGVPDDQAKEAYTRMKRKGFCASIPVYAGAQDGVELLRSVCNIYVVTSPLGGPHWAHEREAWLWEHFRIPSNTVISTSAKYKCVGDVFVDDKTSSIVKWQQVHPRGLAVRWNTRACSKDVYEGVGTNNWHELRGMVVGLNHVRSVR